MRADSEASELPAPFRALPRLLRDDALRHLHREVRASATCHTPHPLDPRSIQNTYALRLPGASQLTIHLDARSRLGIAGSGGSAALIFSRDEAGEDVISRWNGETTAGWSNLTISGDSLWVHVVGELPKKELAAKSLWGFCVRITASSWKPPEKEVDALEMPLPIGWQLLELICRHRPAELLTTHTYRVLVHYLHAADAPHRALAAALLLRLFDLAPPAPSGATSGGARGGASGRASDTLATSSAGVEGSSGSEEIGHEGAAEGSSSPTVASSSATPAMLSSASADPRDAWAMDSLLSLAPHVEWHRNQGCDKVSGLAPPHVQLCAELVALARDRASADAVKEMPKEVVEWADSILELREAAQSFLASSPSAASSLAPQRWHRPPRAWIDRLTQEGLAVDELDDGGAWAVGKWAALLRVAASEAREANVSTAARRRRFCPAI